MAFSSEVTDEDFEQPRELWKIFLRTGEDKNFITNLAGHLKKAVPEVQKETISKFPCLHLFYFCLQEMINEVMNADMI